MGYGIDVGASAVKVVGVRRTLKGFKLTGAARRRFGKSLGADEHKAAAGKLLRETLGQETRRVGVVGLSGRDVNLRMVQQPGTSTVNYRQMMFYEVDQAKGTAGDLYADYCTLREPDSYFPQFLAMVGIGKAGYVDERIAMAASAGVDVRDAVPNCFALYNAYKNAYGSEGGTVMLLDLGAETMELVLVRGGRMIFARNVSTGARAFDTTIAGMAGCSPEEAEARKIQYGSMAPPGDKEDARMEEVRPAIRTAAGQIAGVITSTIQFARTQLADKELAVDKAYLSGGGARLRGLPEYLQSALKFPVELLDPFKCVDTSALKGVEDFGQLPTDLACPLGLAELSASPNEAVSLSILPEALRKRRNFFKGTLYLAAGGVLLAAVMAVVTGVALVRKWGHESAYHQFKEQTKDIEDRITRMTEVEAKQRDAAAKVEVLMAHLKSGRGLMDAVQKLRRTLPPGVNVQKMEFVDLSEARDPVPRKRCLFHHPMAGLVIGEVAKEDPATAAVTLRTGEEYVRGDLTGYVEWESPALGISVEGEVDENIPGKAGPALETVRSLLGDSLRGVAAEIVSQASAAQKPGWRNFKILIRFE